MKTLKTLFALLAMLLCSTSCFAAVDYDFKVDGICYDITSETDNTVRVTYNDKYDYYNQYTEYSGSVSIPESVTYNGTTYSVTSIGSSAFRGCSGLTSVTIPNSVTSIGDNAFSGCSGLTSVTIPNSVTSIGSYAFYYCSGLTSIEIPNSVTSIGSYAFYDCDDLTSIEIPNSVTGIGDYAFRGCSGLTSVTIGNSVTSIGNYAFYGCDDLRTVVNNSNLNIVAGSSNYGNVGYYAYRILSGENINGYYFDENNGEYTLTGYWGDETNLVLPENYKGNAYIINNNAFRDCSGLTSVTIPNSVTSIGDYAFYGCSIKSLTIGTGVLSIGSKQSNPVKTIWLTNTPPSGYKNLQGTINYVANDQYSGLSNVKVYPYLSSAFETGGVKYVPVSPAERTCDAIDCSYDSDVVDINIGKTVSFKGVEMKVQNVMPYTVYKQTSVKTLSVSHAGDIRESAFYGCTALETLTLGENVTSIGGSAFRDCSKLFAVTIPNKTTSLSTYSFYGCSSMKTLKIGDGIVTIPEYAFSGCSSLSSVEWGESVEKIERYSFNGCSALPSIDIPASVTSVGVYTFKGCTSLADVAIKDRTSDLSLGSNGSSPLFADCPLDSVYIGGNISYRTSSSYGYSPFYRNTSLRSVVITDKEKEISDNEFYGCTNLKNVSIGSNVKKIGNWAFSGCSNLDYFSFGKSVESIGEEAFSDCVNMTQLISHAVTPPTCGTQALDDINKWNCTLKIPEGTNSAYMAANQWKEFFFMEDVLECPKFEVVYMIDDEVIATDSIKYGKSITLKDAPVKEGHTFVGWENVPETMPANDITITGSYKVNSYAVKYVVDGMAYATDSLTYGSAITLRDEPTKEGYTFIGWSEAPETMPANDITITGEWSINSYLVTFIIDGEVYATDSVEYGAAITLPEVPEKENSTFEWEEAPTTMPASDVTIYGNYVSGIGGITVSGKADVYTLNGMLYKRDVDLNKLNIELPKGVYIINGKKFMVR